MQPPFTTRFEAWIRDVFDHPVADSQQYPDIEVEESGLTPADCIGFLARLFEEPALLLEPYSDAQVNQGLRYLVDAGSSNYMFSLLEPEFPWPQRQRVIRAMATVFERLFARRCSNHLSHLDQPGINPLNWVCYMWWDLLWYDMIPGREPPVPPVYAQVDAECLSVMKQVLALNSLACWESALHGLGHWQRQYPEVVERTIDDFLARVGSVRPELRAYAEWARQGRLA
jgi:hypothetical protein